MSWKTEAAEMGQFFIWLVLMMVLFVEAALFGSPVISRVLVVGPNPISELCDFRMVVASVGSFVALVWWLCRGQQYKRA